MQTQILVKLRHQTFLSFPFKWVMLEFISFSSVRPLPLLLQKRNFELQITEAKSDELWVKNE